MGVEALQGPVRFEVTAETIELLEGVEGEEGVGAG